MSKKNTAQAPMAVASTPRMQSLFEQVAPAKAEDTVSPKAVALAEFGGQINLKDFLSLPLSNAHELINNIRVEPEMQEAESAGYTITLRELFAKTKGPGQKRDKKAEAKAVADFIMENPDAGAEEVAQVTELSLRVVKAIMKKFASA